MKRFIAYALFEKKLQSETAKDHYEEVTLLIDANSEAEALDKAKLYTEQYENYSYIGGNNNLVTHVFTNYLRVDEILGFEKENGVEEINSTSFYNLKSYLDYKFCKI